MVQQYASFLLRCWRLASGEQRIKVEHVQSGASTQVETLAAALAWLEAHPTSPVRDAATAVEREAEPPGEETLLADRTP
jgi:hypothetical protein